MDSKKKKMHKHTFILAINILIWHYECFIKYTIMVLSIVRVYIRKLECNVLQNIHSNGFKYSNM